MEHVDRRGVLRRLLAGSCAGLGVSIGGAKSANAAAPPDVERWMDSWMSTARRDVHGELYVSRFKDPIYFLLKTISWSTNPGASPAYATVEVPVGFVTDFASIPRAFYSILRPDGDYCYASVIHDYLYWQQDRPREEADAIFKLAMEDFSVAPATVLVLYDAVRSFGGLAWSENAAAKRSGERRVLTRLPDDPRITWADYKTDASVFR